MVAQPGGVAYHVWLELGDKILDTTLYTIKSKAAQLDALDGGHTTVDWCPEYLFVSKNTVSLLKDVIQFDAGMYYYSRDRALESLILSTAPVLDADDIETAWLIFQNPNLAVFGPNSLKEGVKQ